MNSHTLYSRNAPFLLMVGMIAGAIHPHKNHTGGISVAVVQSAHSQPDQVASPHDFTGTAPTVVCDGKGGYRVEAYGHEQSLLGRCYVAHEQSHRADLERICPNGCKNQRNGTLHATDAPRCAAFKEVSDYNDWRQESECKAYSAEKRCLKELAQRIMAEQQKANSADIRYKLNDMLSSLRHRSRKVRCSRAFYKCGDEGDENIKPLFQCTGISADVPPGF